MNNKPQLENGFLRIATDISKYLARTYMSSYESQILWAIFIKTYGFNKKEDWISNSQFVEITGIEKGHVSRTIKKLIERKIVARIGNKIAFQKDSTLWCKLPKQATVAQIGNSVAHSVLKVAQMGLKLPKQAYTIDNIQKTLTIDTIQKKYSSIKEIDFLVMEEIAEKYHVQVSFVQSKFDDMQNWMESKGKRYKNYKAALMNWVKSDAIKIVQRERQVINKFQVTKV